MVKFLLECATSEHCCTCFLYSDSSCDYLLLSFNRARTCNDLKLSAAYLSACNVDNSIIRVELSVSILVRLLNTLYIFNTFLSLNCFYIDLSCVANKTDNI